MSAPAIQVALDDGLPAPVVGARSVGSVIQTLHEHTLDAGLAALCDPALTRSTIEPILTYCAEQRCVADRVTCVGCRRRTDARGWTSLTDVINTHAEVRTRDGLSIAGQGSGRLEVTSLDDLARNWAGVERWFEARRVIRKLRHGVRTRDLTLAGTGAAPAVILVEPQLPENIGMVARAMANFGLEDLRLVAPRDAWPNEKARIAASGATFVIDEAAAYPTYPEAFSGLHWVCATTARQRDLAKPVLTPAQATAEMRRRIADGQRCGIVFGRERNGLETSEVALADAVVMIPVDSRFASLNLAQAVLLLGYEWLKDQPTASLGRVTTYETARGPGRHDRGFGPADKADLIGLFEHLERELDHAGFFPTPEKRPTVVNNLRTLLSRMEPSTQEVRTLRGIVKALVRGRGQHGGGDQR
jgi:tRNA/rRNA methyltransferase